MDFSDILKEFAEAIQKLLVPFESLAEAFRELNRTCSRVKRVKYASQKWKNTRKDTLKKARNTYSYTPVTQRNMPYQRRIF